MDRFRSVAAAYLLLGEGTRVVMETDIGLYGNGIILTSERVSSHGANFSLFDAK